MAVSNQKQIQYLTRLQLCNLYGINVFRHSKDKKVKRRMLGLMAAYVLVALVLVFYMGGMAYGLIWLGMGELTMTYLILVASLLSLIFSIFKAGGVLFEKGSYDTLCALPVTKNAIVISRLIRMYVEDLIASAGVILPGMAVYGYLLKPELSFYLLGLIGILGVPLLPLTISSLVGALITAVSSRMKHKNLVSAGLTVLLVIGILYLSGRITQMDENTMILSMTELTDTVNQVIRGLYPPAVWLGEAITFGNAGITLACTVGSLMLLLGTGWLISVKFHQIHQLLHSHTAKHNYQMQKLQKNSIGRSLYRREVKRYFASGIYVTNTIIGPIMGLAMAIAILAVGVESVEAAIPLSLHIREAIPFLFPATAGMMTTTSVSISMEGRQWWLMQSLPVEAKQLFDSKILLNLTLVAPFYVVSEVLLVLALRPGLMELLWLVAVPPVMLLFVSVLGISVNIKLPVFRWESETAVVKQSASALVGGLGGALIVMICALLVLASPLDPDLTRLLICGVILALTAFLYRKNNQINLKELN